jgi:hypothetical protein
MSATYSGDVTFGGGVSNLVTQTVTAVATTTTTVISSNNPSVLGANVTFTATVTSSGSPAGTVSFFDGVTLLGTGLLSGGVATFSTSALAAGAHNITASYGGDANDTVSTSPVLVQNVIAAVPALDPRLLAALGTALALIAAKVLRT